MTKGDVQKPLGPLSPTIAEVPLEATVDLRPGVLCALGQAWGSAGTWRPRLAHPGQVHFATLQDTPVPAQSS